MVLSQHRRFICKTAIVIFSHSLLFASGWADANGARVTPHRLVAAERSKGLGGPSEGKDSAFAVINQVEATKIGQQVEIRIVAGSPLSCTPFRLTDPDRLVLDCPKAHALVVATPIHVDQDSVRSVRVGQFKPNMARVVVDLEGQPAFNIRRDSNRVIVTIQSVDPKLSAFEPSQKMPASLPFYRQNLSVVSTRAPVMQDDASATKHAENSAAGPPTDDAPPSIRPASAWAPAGSPARVSSTSSPVQETGTEGGPPSDKPALTLPEDDYVIGAQDVLAINVWREPEISRSVPVRPDGKISLPLVGDLTVSGLTPRVLQARLETALNEFINRPQVTVIIQEANSRKFYIMGQVEKPGTYSLATHVAVLDALAMAGGFRDFAKVRQIYLLRQQPDGSRKRVHFDYKAAVNGKSTYRDIELQPGDTLVVP